MAARRAAAGADGAAPVAPARADDLLAAPTSSIKGIGPALAAALAARGLVTVEDLLWFVPKRWLDARAVADLDAALAEAVAGDRINVRATVTAARMVRVRARRWGEVRFAAAPGGPPILTVRWFNVFGGIDTRFPVGAEVALSGLVKKKGRFGEMANPDVLAIAAPGGELDVGGVAKIMPRYSEVAGVPAAKLRAACQAAVGRALARPGTIDDGVPAAVAARVTLPPLDEALAALHAPAPTLTADEVAALEAATSPYHRRLVFAELFALGVVIARRRRARRGDQAPALVPTMDVERELAAALPFALTAAQRRAIGELRADLVTTTPMNRLLQGDVGAGKTAVAFAAALHAVRSGAQVALMAPTELLAEQHHATLRGWTRGLGVTLACLTASTPRAERARILAGCADGSLGLIVGTHALLADAIELRRLGLVIVDEQHRFGVAQRVKLRDKGVGAAPHLLVMTATPIPRTLALTAYGDLDATIIDEVPPGRQPPTTEVVRGPRGRVLAYQRLVERARAGERGFVVCPLVEATGDEGRRGWASATAVHAELTRALAPLRVGLCHGQLTAAEREAAMAAFVAGAIDVLVATTVIEVGVDVPAATVMVIEDADHFGLAQLHQLRGRIGRGGGPSWCLLCTRGTATDDGVRRLAVIAETGDGFRIAEEDLALRGPGELLGARQAGLPRLRYGDLRRHTELLLLARAEAEQVIAADPALTRPEHAALAIIVARREQAAAAFGSESG